MSQQGCRCWLELRWSPELSPEEPLKLSSLMDLTHLLELSSWLDIQALAVLWSGLLPTGKTKQLRVVSSASSDVSDVSSHLPRREAGRTVAEAVVRARRARAWTGVIFSGV